MQLVSNVEVPVAQQGIPGPPQVPQAPLEHVPANEPHELPLATHSPDTQQPPVQVFPAQHALPAAPQVLPPAPAVLPPLAGLPPPPVPVAVPPVTETVPPVTGTFPPVIATIPPEVKVPPVFAFPPVPVAPPPVPPEGSGLVEDWPPVPPVSPFPPSPPRPVPAPPVAEIPLFELVHPPIARNAAARTRTAE